MDNPAAERIQPVFFWQFEPNKVFDDYADPYIEPELQEGTTPLAKIMAGKFTRNFKNFRYTDISEDHMSGERSVMLNQYKLIVDGRLPDSNEVELYNIDDDPAEQNNLAEDYPDVVNQYQQTLHKWQMSVLHSLTGSDYINQE